MNKKSNEIIQIVISDYKQYKGMWIAYGFLFTSMVAIITLSVWVLYLFMKLAEYMILTNATWRSENPIMLFAIIVVPLLAYGLLIEVHALYRDIRRIIKKGNQ